MLTETAGMIGTFSSLLITLLLAILLEDKKLAIAKHNQ
jgi:hypothetical protein